MAPITLPYKNRAAAGRALAGRLLSDLSSSDPLILALPRGGVPVAAEVALALGADLDLMMVRRIGIPGQLEFAMGAVATGGICLRNDKAIRLFDVPYQDFQRIRRKEERELERRDCLYRSVRPFPAVRGRDVILIGDGLATGTSMLAAIRAIGCLHPLGIAVAVPVGAREAISKLARVADEVVCLATPEPFLGVGLNYVDYTLVSDDDVCAALHLAWQPPKRKVKPSGVMVSHPVRAGAA